MFFTFLLFGSFWFYVVAAIAVLLLTIFVETEKGGLAFFTLFAAIGAYLAFGDKGAVLWIRDHPIQIAEYLGIYVGIGIVWSFTKWFFYVLGKRDLYEKYRAMFLATTGGTTVDKAAFSKFLMSQGKSPNEFPPNVAKNKGRIIFWMSYWPFSGLWTLIHDPATRLFNFLYTRLGMLFEKISHSMFAKYENEL